MKVEGEVGKEIKSGLDEMVGVGEFGYGLWGGGRLGVGRLEELGMAGGGRGGFVFLCICVFEFFLRMFWRVAIRKS